MRIVVAGSAAPETLFRRFDTFGVRVIQPWGMTETTPIATVCTLKPHMHGWSDDRAVRAAGQAGAPLAVHRDPRDGGRRRGAVGRAHAGRAGGAGTVGRASYYEQPEENDKWSDDGWFQTGDVVTIDPEGYMKITDRTKDLIKSGGEWISSVDVENALVAHPAVAEAAVIAVPDRQVAGAAAGSGGAEGGMHGDRRGAADVSRAHVRQVAAAGSFRLRAGTASHVDRKAAEIRTAPRYKDWQRPVEGAETPTAGAKKAAAPTA